MKDIHIKPQDRLAYMEKKKMKLISAGHYMNDETFLSYVLTSLPQEEYQTLIVVLKDKLRKGTLTIEEAENLLDDKFKAMKDINGWNEEGEEHALVV